MARKSHKIEIYLESKIEYDICKNALKGIYCFVIDYGAPQLYNQSTESLTNIFEKNGFNIKFMSNKLIVSWRKKSLLYKNTFLKNLLKDREDIEENDVYTKCFLPSYIKSESILDYACLSSSTHELCDVEIKFNRGVNAIEMLSEIDSSTDYFCNVRYKGGAYEIGRAHV